MKMKKTLLNQAYIQAWELSVKMQISMAVEVTLRRGKKNCPQEKEIGGTKNKPGSINFSSATECP